MKIAEALFHGAKKLRNAGVVLPEKEADSLLRFAIGKERAFVVANPDFELTHDQFQIFERITDRRSLHEPFQYITGSQEFFGLEFRVTPDVLIPRPETEILVETAIKEFINKKRVRFCEVGVGSGCISIAILANLHQATAVSVDVSPEAIEIARSNADRHNVTDRIDLLESNLFENVYASDLEFIVSNPPYVPDRDLETLQREVRDFEPRMALSGGSDGLLIIRRIIQHTPSKLKKGGMLFMEIGWDQAEAVHSLFNKGLWRRIVILPDLQGIPRIIAAELN